MNKRHLARVMLLGLLLAGLLSACDNRSVGEEPPPRPAMTPTAPPGQGGAEAPEADPGE